MQDYEMGDELAMISKCFREWQRSFDHPPWTQLPRDFSSKGRFLSRQWIHMICHFCLLQFSQI